MLANGFTMLSQQLFTFYVPNGDVAVFSFLSFFIVGLCLLLAALFFARKDGDNENDKLKPNLLWYWVILAGAVFVINQLATSATAIVPPAILFAFINGGGMIIGTIVAAVCYREKITVQSAVGVLLGVISLFIVKFM